MSAFSIYMNGVLVGMMISPIAALTVSVVRDIRKNGRF